MNTIEKSEIFIERWNENVGWSIKSNKCMWYLNFFSFYEYTIKQIFSDNYHCYNLNIAVAEIKNIYFKLNQIRTKEQKSKTSKNIINNRILTVIIWKGIFSFKYSMSWYVSKVISLNLNEHAAYCKKITISTLKWILQKCCSVFFHLCLIENSTKYLSFYSGQFTLSCQNYLRSKIE